MSVAGRLTVECSRCGRVFQTWPAPSPDLDCDPELGDPGWIGAAAEATCPHCGSTACCSGLAAEREARRTAT
jgi:DNA-directed RNA polymerase subunit RPC12/RpoP